MYDAKVITISDRVVAGVRKDSSGPAACQLLAEHGWEITGNFCVPDGIRSVSEILVECAREFTGLIVTSGGTGFGVNDHTPEATKQCISREAPGLAEFIRADSPKGLGRLNRGVAGILDQSLIVNLPGSEKAVRESLQSVLEVLPHMIDLIADRPTH